MISDFLCVISGSILKASSMENIWDKVFLHNSLRDWTTSLVIIIVSLFVLRFFQSVIIRKIRNLTSRTKSTLDDFLINTVQSSVMPLLYVMAVYFGLKYLKIPQRASEVANVAVMVVNCFFILRIITTFISYSFRRGMSNKEKNTSGIIYYPDIGRIIDQ